MFDGWDVEAQFRCLASHGYAGVEIAPYTLAETVSDISTSRRLEVRNFAEAAGIEVTGLHWLLAGPAAEREGWHLSHPDAAVRAKTVRYLESLVHLCAELGGRYLILGSPKQRSTVGGVSVMQAREFVQDSLVAVLPTLRAANVVLCLEPLPLAETDVVTTCDEALSIIDVVADAHLRLVLDVKSLCAESRLTHEPVPDIIRRVGSAVAYVQANDENRGHPGSGAVDFVPICAALRDISYAGWVSVEPFVYDPGPETIARESMSCLSSAWAATARR